MKTFSILSGDWFYGLFNSLVRPKSKDKDMARREFILNILLIGAAALSFLVIVLVARREFLSIRTGGSSLITLFAFFALNFGGYLIAKAGRSFIVAHCLIFLYFLGATYTAFTWGASAPQVLLIYSLIIVMSGVLINSRGAFLMTGLVSVTLFFLISLQSQGIISTNTSWRKVLPTLVDASVYSGTLFVIAIISWLSNRETEKALKRARLSELALKKERDLLEVKVEERTQELKQAQVEKMLEVHRFAEFGRLTSGLFHELVNPLTIVSLNLEQLNFQSKKADLKELSRARSLLKQAINGTRRMELFIKAARKQVQNQDTKTVFPLTEEIDQAMGILAHKAKMAKVKVVFSQKDRIQTFGNPIKFNQLVTNLIANAVDAYEEVEGKLEKKLVEIKLKKRGDAVYITVQDWGSGISGPDINKIFTPFFTTKSMEQGTGIGLAISKDIVEKDFSGQITVKSKKDSGTTFTVILPLKKDEKI